MAMAENKRILRKWLSALQSGDLETLRALQSKDCVWILPGSFTVKRGKVTAWEAFENTEIIAACY